MAMSYIDKYGDGKINGFVGIGMGATDYKQKLVNGFPLHKMATPILDIYAEQDFSGVRKLANYRKQLIKMANNKKSMQVIVPDADHYYKNTHSVNRLTTKVANWLNAL
jgi:alpha/beta superfamily hydrolase